MNICILTAKIVKAPKLLFKKNYFYTQLILSIPNNKKGLNWYNIRGKARGQKAKDLFDLYMKGDFVIVEGTVKIKKKESRKKRVIL